MALNLSNGANTALLVLATLCAAGAGFLWLASALMSGGFAGRVPAGADAMGLVVPLFGSIGAGLLALVATGALSATGRLGWLGPNASVTAFVLVLGVSGAAVAVLIAWMERMGGWVVPVGLFAGALAPLVATSVLIASAWRTPPEVAAMPWTRVGVWILAGACGVAIALSLFGLARTFRAEAARESADAAEAARATQEADRLAALSPVERLHAEYADMSPDAPLWVFIAALPDPHPQDVHAAMIERARRVPALDADIIRTIGDRHPRFRHGTAILLRDLPDTALKPEFADALAAAIDLTADQIAADPEWLIPDDFANPDPIGHLAVLAEAAIRFPPDLPSLLHARKHLRDVLASTPATEARVTALAAWPAP